MKQNTLLALITGLLMACAQAPQPTPIQNTVNTKFKHEGQLTIYLADRPIKILAIEIADDQEQISQGLMFRTKMEDNQGMLFIYPDATPRQFWMKNTHIPLDIIYLNKDKRILNIAEHAKPYALTGIAASQGNAMYVLEINAGLSKKWGVTADNSRIDFEYY